jgi:subtilisin family serine protease
VLLSVLLLSVLLPAAVLGAPAEQTRNYVVALAVSDALKTFEASSRSDRQRIRQRAERASSVTNRLAAEYGFRTRHRFERTAPGFSARMTTSQAARVAADQKVLSVRPARRFKLAAQSTPRGIRRVKAAPDSPGGPDVDVDIAVLDTGIGPVGGTELDIAGGINCADNPSAPGYDADDWEDSISSRHGTHVAGIAAARNNSIGVVGVAPGARLWSVRVFDGPFGDEATIVCGIQWAISTHDGPLAPAGTQPIEVINMSLQGPRDAIVEACPGAPGDLMHRAICEAVEVGITVVVAAGNSSSDARRVSPAGYDQVITVGALSDFDGQGGGHAATDCPFYDTERDDTYARYSNYGPDVDIVAPGTCVVSTTTGNVGATRTLTGTSMSSPHVAGAVARYLAVHPGTPPEQMRRLVRASGRMDWDPKSDPLWSGIRDADEPNRVLDVKALTGPDALKVWLYRDTFGVSKDETKRSTRVDVQRGGGYAGQVTLDVRGLPGSVGSATFDDDRLSGLAGLGTNVALRLKTSGPDGIYDLDVAATGNGGAPVGNRALTLTVDRSGPKVTGLGVRPRVGNTPLAKSGKAKVLLQWNVGDALSKIKKVTLERKIGSGPWKSVKVAKGWKAAPMMKPGKKHRFRVKAVDALRNKTTKSVAARLSVRDSDSDRWVRPASGGWRTRALKKAYGGSLLQAERPAEALVTPFRGKAFAVVAPVGPGRGGLRLRIDGGAWHRVDLKASRTGQKRVVFSRRVQAGFHRLEIEGLSSRSAVDAILIIH